MVKLQKLPNGQLVLTIPKQLAALKGWDKGITITFKEHDKNSFVIEANTPSQNSKKDERVYFNG
ncbi:hypothetical protein J4206_05870 [Candidatus Woesearchaeota archaeon]|nr:hypothetical protein [Candidatus Woesearchaeota archaeon]